MTFKLKCTIEKLRSNHDMNFRRQIYINFEDASKIFLNKLYIINNVHIHIYIHIGKIKHCIFKKEKDAIIYYKKNDFPDTAIINPNTGKNPESNKIINLNNFAELNNQLSSHFKIIGVTITNYC